MRKVSSTAEIIGVSKPPIAIGFFESPRQVQHLLSGGLINWMKERLAGQ